MRPSALAMVLFAAGCVQPHSPPVPEDAVRIGVLLPFTGEQAALGRPVERALILARDAINEAGGIGDRPIVLDVRDTHSGAERGYEVARTLVESAPMAILGPEEAELAVALLMEPRADETLLVLPGVAAPSAAQLTPLTQRIGPPLPTLGGAMAQEIRSDGATRLAVVHGGGPYASELANLVACEFTRDRADTHASLVLDVSDESRSVELLQGLAPWSPDAIALIAFPRSGAILVRDAVAFLAVDTPWYLAPSLQTDEFVRNVPPGVLDGAFGLSAALDVFASTPISNAYRARFPGSIDGVPDGLVVTGYYYHDALALVALAATAALAAGEDPDDPEVLQRHLVAVASPPGETIETTTLAVGLERAAAGVDVDYEGATGSLDMDERGAVLESNLGTWMIVDGETRASSLPLATFRGFLDSPCASVAP